MSRVVPAGMMNDPDFMSILKEKARTSAPSETDSASSSVSVSSSVSSPTQPKVSSTSETTQAAKKTRQKKFKGAARIIDKYDPNMIPDIERRLTDRRESRDEAARLYRGNTGGETVQAPPSSIFSNFSVADMLKTWQFYVTVALVILVGVIIVRRQKMIRQLGISYALVAELPFLLPVCSIISGTPVKQLQGEIRQFELGIHPRQTPTTLPSDLVQSISRADEQVQAKPAEPTAALPHRDEHAERVDSLLDEVFGERESQQAPIIDDDENEEEHPSATPDDTDDSDKGRTRVTVVEEHTTDQAQPETNNDDSLGSDPEKSSTGESESTSTESESDSVDDDDDDDVSTSSSVSKAKPDDAPPSQPTVTTVQTKISPKSPATKPTRSRPRATTKKPDPLPASTSTVQPHIEPPKKKSRTLRLNLDDDDDSK